MLSGLPVGGMQLGEPRTCGVEGVLRVAHLHAPPATSRPCVSQVGGAGEGGRARAREGGHVRRARAGGRAAYLQPHISRWRIFMRRSSTGLR